MMRKLFFILFTLCVSLANGQVLYQISGNGAQANSYLIATNKLTDISFLDTIPNLFKCYGQSDKVITEFAMIDYQAIAALRQAAILPDSIRLSHYYTTDEYQLIDESLQLTLGMGIDKLGRMKPQYLTEMYRVELLKKWAGYDDNRSSEHFFETVARQQNKPIFGLDDIGETMFMQFDREPFHWQCTELKNIIEYPEREIKLEKNIRDLYKMGRLLDISYLISSPDNLSTISYSDYQVYIKRNKEWVKRLKPYLIEGKAFIVLDAMYLGGEGGLIALLKAAGYKVKPVNRK
ncbi:MAG: TraB/GumN family protein [Paludibacteraceae bacterium]|nr:TraB/GumN family protein [Paludibacteraceae bacterium]